MSEIKRTGGGAYDPDAQRHVYFGAGQGAAANGGGFPPYTLAATNDMMGNTRELDHRLSDGQTVLLDSGIFWLTNRHKRAHPGMSMDEALGLAPEDIDGFEELFARYVEITSQYGDRLWGYIELDQGGMENKRRTRERLESLGLRPIPVYHPLNDGWDYFDELASSYDRICVGNIVQAASGLRTRILRTLWERKRAYPHLWVHGLGYTPNALLHAYPLDSVDSSTWLAPLRWFTANKSVATNLEHITDHQHESHQIHKVRRVRHKADALVAWTVHAATMQWRAQRAELDALGLPALPPRYDTEEPLCPAP